MDSDKLIAIAIAAAIGALVKELFTAGIKHSATTAKKLLKAAPSFITRHWKKIDFLLTLFGLLYFLFIFFHFGQAKGFGSGHSF
ncbi:hypothetical protein HZ994_09480 [Akkermansiaceae bacterium]|nr:hypothetical protein HZ994_09480 [Akkermansiaceae bacterium]